VRPDFPQDEWEREVAAQEAAIRSELVSGAPGGDAGGDAARLAQGQPAARSLSPGASDRWEGDILPAGSCAPDDLPLASLLSKAAQALPQAGHSPGPGARVAEQQGGPPAEAAALPPVAPQAHAIAAVARKMDAASLWLDRLDVADPQCERVLTVLQTCALTLSLLSGGTRPHGESVDAEAMQRIMNKRPTLSGWERPGDVAR
jgi:hypothetical protein